MHAVLLDFNGTLFFDSCFHLEAWSEIYQELHGGTGRKLDSSMVCGPCNDAILQKMACGLTSEERQKYSIHKEEVYRKICMDHPDELHLTAGAEALLEYLKKNDIPFILASASIIDNIEFYFRIFDLGRWFDRNLCVYDDGSYADKGEMHLEAARRLGTTLPECVVIEDSLSAVTLAKKNGAGRIIAVGNDSIRPELIRAGAAHCIHDFTKFDLEWLRN